MQTVHIEKIDPQSEVALSLLREAAKDAWTLYPELFAADTAWPTNPPLSEGELYVAAVVQGLPVGSGALRRIDPETAEIKRMYVHREHRRKGIGKTILAHLVREAKSLAYRRLVLETGFKQSASMALYESFGFRRVPAFGNYRTDPTSVCYELQLSRDLNVA